MDGKGRLAKSPQANAHGSSVYGFTAGSILDFAEVQTSVGLPKYDAPPVFNTPELPKPKMRQLVQLLGEMKGIDLAELSYEVRAYIPGKRPYANELDLPRPGRCRPPPAGRTTGGRRRRTRPPSRGRHRDR
jgi:hypothetical protein